MIGDEAGILKKISEDLYKVNPNKVRDGIYEFKFLTFVFWLPENNHTVESILELTVIEMQVDPDNATEFGIFPEEDPILVFAEPILESIKVDLNSANPQYLYNVPEVSSTEGLPVTLKVDGGGTPGLLIT